MPRISIYVTDDLKSRMDGFGDRLNWSALAQETFKRELDANTIPSNLDLESTISRLRVSKVEFEKIQLEAGRTAGHRWAMNFAPFSDLRTVGNFNLEFAKRNTLPLITQIDYALGNGDDWHDSLFFEPEDGYPTEEYVLGFVQGAKAVWAEVADKL